MFVYFSVVPVPNSDEELRLVDDGFVKICNMINDISVKVRTKAASLLVSYLNTFITQHSSLLKPFD
jgi:hypothetical protein